MAVSDIIASTLIDSKVEGLIVTRANLRVCVHPAWANNVQQGVREILNSLLLRYNDELGGVVLAYLNIEIPCHAAKILLGLSPYFKVDLTATFLLFSPKMGMILEGKVIKIEKDYIGVLVLGLFNAAIGFNDIREEFHFVEQPPDLQAWISKLNEGHAIKQGTVIRFSVKSVQEKEEILDIAGSLEPTSTGSVNWLFPLEHGPHDMGKLREKGWKKGKEKHAERKQEHDKNVKEYGEVQNDLHRENGHGKEHRSSKKKKHVKKQEEDDGVQNYLHSENREKNWRLA